jgi:hypothetical protein
MERSRLSSEKMKERRGKGREAGRGDKVMHNRTKKNNEEVLQA